MSSVLTVDQLFIVNSVVQRLW